MTLQSTIMEVLVPKIGTHSGTFHCDEALACYMLMQLPGFEYAKIIRSREKSVLDTCRIVVDVGNVYNPKLNRFDHHQEGFNETLASARPDLQLAKFNSIKLSSAGLVYAHFGLEVIKEILQRSGEQTTDESIVKIFAYVYEDFVEEIDAIDNGIPMCSEEKPLYRINTDLSARIHRLNPDGDVPASLHDALFVKAANLAGREFKERVIEAAVVWWPARKIVESAIEKRTEVHESGEIIVFEEMGPWKNHLFTLEEELGIQGQIKFCIFSDSTGSWRVHAVPIQPGSFICRTFLHKDWRGVRDEELSEVAGIPECIFCHHTGFIGGNKRKLGALLMAIKSLLPAEAVKE